MGSKHFCWHMKNFMILRFAEISYRFLIGIPFGGKKITPVVDKILGLKNWGARNQTILSVVVVVVVVVPFIYFAFLVRYETLYY